MSEYHTLPYVTPKEPSMADTHDNAYAFTQNALTKASDWMIEHGESDIVGEIEKMKAELQSDVVNSISPSFTDMRTALETTIELTSKHFFDLQDPNRNAFVSNLSNAFSFIEYAESKMISASADPIEQLDTNPALSSQSHMKTI